MKSYSWNANANPAHVSSANSLFEKGTYAMNVHTEWWSTFFSGLILDAQRNMFPPERTPLILNSAGHKK